MRVCALMLCHGGWATRWCFENPSPARAVNTCNVSLGIHAHAFAQFTTSPIHESAGDLTTPLILGDKMRVAHCPNSVRSVLKLRVD